MQNMQAWLETAMPKLSHLSSKGATASYIPALQTANPNDFGACILSLDGQKAKSGDYAKKFTIQSISKVLTLMCCLIDSPRQRVFERISVEPSPSSFNAIAELETHATRRPLNPMINAGAIVATEFVAGDCADEKFNRIRDMARLLSGNAEIDYSKTVYESERETGDRNRSLAYYMKSTGVIHSDVDNLLSVYFRACALEMTCEDLAKIALVLARDGLSEAGKPLIPKDIVQTARTVMAMCGLYNESGRYAVDVGIPSKSGVGGGILAVVPNKIGIGLYSPSVNENGTGLCAGALMKALSEDFDLRVF